MNMKCMPQKVALFLLENIGTIFSFPSSSPVLAPLNSFSFNIVIAAVPFLNGFWSAWVLSHSTSPISFNSFINSRASTASGWSNKILSSASSIKFSMPFCIANTWKYWLILVPLVGRPNPH